MMRVLFGDDVDRWDKSPLYFLSRTAFKDYIHSRHSGKEARKRELRHDTYNAKDVLVIRMKKGEWALDLYAHSIAYWTMGKIASPLLADGKRDFSRYAWMKEGVGLLATLETYGTADSWFSSDKESTGKLQPSAPLPEKKSRAICLAYVRGQLYDGALPPLREIWGNSLNNLDRFRALYAWTFIRFLALYDPGGFAKLPAALKKQAEGSSADRSERALKEAFGAEPNELVRLWRIYMLELVTG